MDNWMRRARMRRRGSLLETRTSGGGGVGGGGGGGGGGASSLSGSDNSINSASARRSTITRRSFGEPPPPPQQPVSKRPVPGAAPRGAPPTALRSQIPMAVTSPPASASGGQSSTSFSFGPPRPPVTIVHRPTKEARKAEIVAAVTKRLYTQKKKPDPQADPQGAQRPPSGASSLAMMADTSEEAEDEPRELKLCSNARARLQEISKRALALSLHRKRRDADTQTETPGVLRLKERAVGTETHQLADKASQWPLRQPFYLAPFSSPLWPPSGRPRHASDSSEEVVYSDDSLDQQPVERSYATPSTTSLWRVFTLRSGSTFAPPRREVSMDPLRWNRCCQTESARCKVDAGTSVQCDVSTMTGNPPRHPLTRETETMTISNTEKATMTSHEVDVGTMTVPEGEGVRDQGTSTCVPRDTSTMTEGDCSPLQTDAVLLQTAPKQTPEHLMQLLCDVRVSCLPSLPMTSMPPTCSYRLAVPSAPQGVPHQPTPSSPGTKQPAPKSQTQVQGPSTGAPPDIIAQAGPARLEGAGEESRVPGKEFLSLDAGLLPACTGPSEADANRSRSLDSLLHQLDAPAPAPEPPGPAPHQQHSPPAKKFRLPCFAENIKDTPKPTATARPVKDDLVHEEDAAVSEECPRPRDFPLLTAVQRRMLLRLLSAHLEHGRRCRRKRPRPRPRPRAQPPPRSPHTPLGFVELRPSKALLELALDVHAPRRAPSAAPPTLAPRQAGTGTLREASTQSCSDVGAQCVILRTPVSRAKAIQCDLASKRTFSAQTQCDLVAPETAPPPPPLRPPPPPPRVPCSRFLLAPPPAPPPLLLRRTACCLSLTRLSLSRPVPSPTQYLRHLVSLRRHVVLASRPDVQGRPVLSAE